MRFNLLLGEHKELSTTTNPLSITIIVQQGKSTKQTRLELLENNYFETNVFVLFI
jgi:hypothetical protein